MDKHFLKINLTHAQRKVVADLLPNLTDRLKLNQKNPRTISLTQTELETIRAKSEVARPNAENGMKRNSLRHVVDAATEALETTQGIGSIPIAQRLYQFKIILLDFNPVVWRRIQVKGSTLDKFHERIQTAMGWTNSHLHQFDINGERCGDPELLDDGFEDFECVDSTITKLSEIVPRDGKCFRFLYEYDFGDGWEHEVLFEGCLQAEKGRRYPLCVEGEMNCPPEDVGGVWGYAEFIEAINDRDSEEHDRMLEWAGDFDPAKFDVKETTRLMRRGLPDWRQYR